MDGQGAVPLKEGCRAVTHSLALGGDRALPTPGQHSAVEQRERGCHLLQLKLGLKLSSSQQCTEPPCP